MGPNRYVDPRISAFELPKRVHEDRFLGKLPLEHARRHHVEVARLQWGMAERDVVTLSDGRSHEGVWRPHTPAAETVPEAVRDAVTRGDLPAYAAKPRSQWTDADRAAAFQQALAGQKAPEQSKVEDPKRAAAYRESLKSPLERRIEKLERDLAAAKGGA